MNIDELFKRYQDLQAYVGWSDEDACSVQSLLRRLEPHLQELVDDFYAEIERHPKARQVITGGAAQVERLKGTLIQWLRELLSGPYDAAYVARRWRVGYRHVEIGLDQVFTNVALSRLRTGMCRIVLETDADCREETTAALRSLNKLIDLDLAIIEDAYQAEYTLRQQRAERLAAVGQVAGGIAHELRNPLNVIKTSVYYLLNARNPSPEKRTEHLSRIEAQVGLADSVITALSNFARLPIPEREAFSIEECLRKAIELNSMPRDIEVVLDCADALPPVLADAGQVQIVVGNLIRNARDAMPDGGRLTVAAREFDGRVEVSVADTGHGIAADDLKRILEPFYSTRARGIGLGLAISRSILDRNEGTLAVESEVGKGTTFLVRLPAACQDIE